MQEDDEVVRFILFTTSFATSYIRGNIRLTEAKIKAYPDLVPIEYLKFIKRATLEQIINQISQYRDNQFYSRDIEIILSPRGIKWLEENIPIIKKVAEEMGI
jgi:hypothetical protein